MHVTDARYEALLSGHLHIANYERWFDVLNSSSLQFCILIGDFFSE